jgi:hypothetical protein
MPTWQFEMRTFDPNSRRCGNEKERLALAPGSIEFSITSLDETAGQISITLSNLSVAGFSQEYGGTDVPTCDGTVEISVEGNYEHEPG